MKSQSNTNQNPYDYYYSGGNDPCEVSWYARNNYYDSYVAACADPYPGIYGTKPVKKKKPNELDLYDMSGNVAEWCWDVSSTEYYDKVRALRGGYFKSIESILSNSSLRVSHSVAPSPYDRGDDIGFRVVCK
jgi:formylglycine-generating enzyme required for sulfatase activity